jgi:uncharacterized lipoprotein YbaY
LKQHRVRILSLLAVLAAAVPALAQPAAADGTEPAAPATPGMLPPAVPPPPALPASVFICTDGSEVKAAEQPSAGVLRVTRLGQSYVLFAAAGVNPPRYVAREGTVILEGDNAWVTAPGHAAVKCEHVPGSPVAGTVWGRIGKADRAAIVEGTRATVSLVDGRGGASLAAVDLRASTNQMPLSFLLRYDPNRIETAAAGRYSLMVRVSDPKGRLLYTGASAPLFAEGPAEPPVEVKLQPAR